MAKQLLLVVRLQLDLRLQKSVRYVTCLAKSHCRSNCRSWANSHQIMQPPLIITAQPRTIASNQRKLPQGMSLCPKHVYGTFIHTIYFLGCSTELKFLKKYSENDIDIRGVV